MRLVALLTLVLAVPAFAPANAPQPVATAQQVLDEVNAQRAQRGLRPYLLDENLARGAGACAVYRAQHQIAGHTNNDFAFLPPGTVARAGGCAAWPVGMGWGSCCTYDGYQFAGAGFCVGADGKRYMHLFVR